MFECFGRKWAHRDERRRDRMAVLSALRDLRPDADIFVEAWLEYRQERHYWQCACAKADGVAVEPAK